MKHLLKNSLGGIEIYLLFLLIIAGVAFVGGFHPLYSLNSQPDRPDYLSPETGVSAQIRDNTSPANQGLQMQQPIAITKTPPTTTPQPSPSQPAYPQEYCPLHGRVINNCTCQPGEVTVTCQGGACVSVDGGPCTSVGFNIACNGIDSGQICNKKPVIYLYPIKDTIVNVRLVFPGTLTVSDPKISPISPTGWQNVLAHPDGTMDYQNKTYHELFYETSLTKKANPQRGITVSIKNIRQTLTSLTSRLGLLPNEQKEFLDFWVPKLQSLNSPYIFVSLYSQQQKDSIDHVEISPQPDTFIEMLFYFKPLTTPTFSTPLILPQTPRRVGFTAVEWGGTLEGN